jgi:hypothetical protein
MWYSQSNNQREAILCAPGWSLHQLRKTLAQDRILGIQRAQIPMVLIDLPSDPQSISFQELADAICSVAACRHIAPETSQQAIWMRCVQHYWQAKAIALANKIYKLIPDPEVDGSLTKMLPARALANLKLDVEADLAWYNLLKAGEPTIKAWAEQQKIPYPFTNFEQLFIETLKEGFEISLSEEAFAPSSNSWSRKQERDHYRGWLKFLGDHFDGEPKEKGYEAVLRSMGWKGYALQALRGKKREKSLGKLWQTYLKAQRPLCQFLDSRLEWKDGIPYQSVTVNKRRNKTQKPIQGIVTDEGYLDWQWR